jgi:maltose-binding protein MalE
LIEIYTDKKVAYIEAVAEVLGLTADTKWTETDIMFEFSKKLDGDAGGYCFGDVDSVEIEIATHVQGEKLSEDTILQNIAHEMIHAKQIIEGRLEDLGLQLATTGDTQTLVKAQVWEGEIITNLAYEDQPWEIEAYSNEERVKLEALQLLEGN